MNICAVILAGGSGSRLWPLSRAHYPKQFIPLVGDQTMLQASLSRLEEINISSLLVISNEEHRFLVAEQLKDNDKVSSIILEPVGRNTAPAIALAALASKDDPLLLVLPSDHVIEDIQTFKKTVLDAVPFAESGKLVTFGIKPIKVHSGYGYIRRGKQTDQGYLVDKFVEKPDIKQAQKYIDSGEYYWNSGIFLFRASRYLEILKTFRKDIYKSCESSYLRKETDLSFTRVDKELFEACPSESIDYAIMENTSDAVVIEMNAEWNDVGSWKSLWEVSKKDKEGNSLVGDVVTNNVSNSYLRSEHGLLAVLGLDNVAVIATKDVLMVANKDNEKEVKNIFKELKKNLRTEWESHREVYRPWGKYDSIDKTESYQVKRITVNPKAKLSLQMHHHRAEHWVVVSGIAKVTKGDDTFLLKENESTYIPLGTVHSLENPGDENLELIEVQSGSYLGEDDIVRFEDRYGRVKP